MAALKHFVAEALHADPAKWRNFRQICAQSSFRGTYGQRAKLHLLTSILIPDPALFNQHQPVLLKIK
jgi:hypothetical protein